ncbi:MAG: glutaredoxin [Gallionellaceae bacterium]|nr:MAG: glutaredoxin [Gallionellaceae bacterium]
MRTLFKIFFRTLRLVLMPFMLLWARFGAPKGVVRSAEVQQAVDASCSKLALYHFPTCPFCIKVRHEMARLSLPIVLRNAQHDPKFRAELEQAGGKIQTPCLRIVDVQGEVKWMYESETIKLYLQQQFA